MIKILSDTLAPPMMAVKGFSDFNNTFSALETSPSMSRPNIFLSASKKSATIAVDAWALCAVPNASLMYTSPNVLNCSANPMSPFSSSLWKRRFSSNNTSPFCSKAAACAAASPMQSAEKKTSGSSPSSFCKWGTRWISEYFLSGPSFGLPKWLIRITDPPSCNTF